jgi:hypothetical protein
MTENCIRFLSWFQFKCRPEQTSGHRSPDASHETKTGWTINNNFCRVEWKPCHLF